jgi:hypothetical protein
VGQLRYREHRSCPEIHTQLQEEGVSIALRSVRNLLAQYDLLLSLALETLPERIAQLTKQGRVILAIDGLQPDVGHEVLWVVRDVLSGTILRARSLLSSSSAELQALIEEVVAALRQHQGRRQRCRFRKHPERDLAALEQDIDKLTLPSWSFWPEIVSDRLSGKKLVLVNKSLPPRPYTRRLGPLSHTTACPNRRQQAACRQGPLYVAEQANVVVPLPVAYVRPVRRRRACRRAGAACA